MSMRVTRVCRLYNIAAREARPASGEKPAVKARPAQKGIFDTGKSWVFDALLLRDPDDPFIPGTPVRRLPTFPLGENATVVLDDEIERVFAELQSWRKTQFEAKRGRRKPTTAEISRPQAE
jgi:hypothetical protein